MTICAGWIHQGSAYLVADSITSYPNRAPTHSDLSSMGEVGPAEFDAIESAVKVYALGSRAIGGLAGDPHAGWPILGDVLRLCGDGRSLQDALAAVRSEFEGVELMLAGHDNGCASLYVNRGDRWGEYYADGDVEVLGSASLEHKYAVRRVVDELRATITEPDHLLVNVLAHARAQCIRYPQMKRGIGGSFFGLRVSGDGVHRHRDTIFALVDRSALPVFRVGRWVLTGWRGDFAFSMAIEPDNRRVTARGHTWDAHAASVNAGALAELRTGEVHPAYVVLIDDQTGAPIVFAQNDYVSSLFIGVSIEGGVLEVRRSNHMMNLLERLPTLEEMVKARASPHHFVSCEDDTRRLVSNGWLQLATQ